MLKEVDKKYSDKIKQLYEIIMKYVKNLYKVLKDIKYIFLNSNLKDKPIEYQNKCNFIDTLKNDYIKEKNKIIKEIYVDKLNISKLIHIHLNEATDLIKKIIEIDNIIQSLTNYENLIDLAVINKNKSDLDFIYNMLSSNIDILFI